MALSMRSEVYRAWHFARITWRALLYIGLGTVILAPVPRASEQTAADGSTRFTPPPQSIAVLPFANSGGDGQQAAFAEGLSAEILNALVSLSDLQVTARTSAFFFKGRPRDVRTVARKLNVGAVLEGEVRRSGGALHLSAQLANGVTGTSLWSVEIDRDVADIPKLKTEIAAGVARALGVDLDAAATARMDRGGTRNPQAFDAYLTAEHFRALAASDAASLQSSIDAYSVAIRLDPRYALALAARSLQYSQFAGEYAAGTSGARDHFDRALADGQKAAALAPDLAQAHIALAYFYPTGRLDFFQSQREFSLALQLAPGSAPVLRTSGGFSGYMGHADADVAARRRALALDPLNPSSHAGLAYGLYTARRYREALEVLDNYARRSADPQFAAIDRGFLNYALGAPERARTACAQGAPRGWRQQRCLAIVYHRLGRTADAQAALAELSKNLSDTAAYQLATIYAQWGDVPRALSSLETALRLRDPGLVLLKTDPLLDPLRREPRFRALEKALNFPL
jgi:TolB-like protein/tetratricopeptide (TPR) repeat protein